MAVTRSSRIRTAANAFVMASVFASAQGCIPVPVVAPPVRVSGTFGGGSSGLSSGTKGAGDLRGRAVGRVGLSPMSFWKEHTRRVIDPEIGVVFEGLLSPPKGDSPDVGGYLGVAWRVWQDRGNSGAQRVFVRATGDLMARYPANDIGGGGSVSVGWEYTDFAAAAVADSSQGLPAFFGYAYGEGGIGVELTGAGRNYGEVAVWQVTAGLTVRIPAVVGVLLVPLWK